jgi:hypothetical protein
MAQSPNRTGSGSKSGTGSKQTGGGGRRRTPPPPVKKPFPWGVVATSAVLGLLLIGILAYAVMNQGSGFTTAEKRLDKKFNGMTIEGDLSRKHVEGAVKYDKSPPIGGDHNSAWENCGVYTTQIPNEHAVHSLEHGAVWITYKPDLAADQVQKLTAFAQSNPYVLVSPYPGLDAPVSLQAWGRQLKVQSADDSKVSEFVEGYAQGPQTPEKGAACSGGTSATGTLGNEAGATPNDGTMQPDGKMSMAPSAAPSPAASKK